MIKGEFKFIRHNKLIMLSVLVIMFIPFLYAIFFLKSVWDPYGDTKDLPVAVVNNDVPVEYQGKTLNVGEQTVEKLRKNDQLGWRFVSAKKAKQGLKDNKYYTVVTIPKNFSANASTVLDAHPKKLQLKYETNDSLNYLSQVISGIGVDKLDTQIRASVTNAYASTLFDQIKTMGNGMSKAAKGATQIADGTVTLDDGVSQYTVGVSKVNDGIQTLKVSVSPLTSGVKQLADGGKQLQQGVGPLASGAAQLVNGAVQLKNGTATLAAGSQKLTDGANQLNAQTGPLGAGINQLSEGANTLSNGLADYTKGTGTLAGGLQELQSNNKDKVVPGIAQIAGGAGQLNAKVPEYVGAVDNTLGQLKAGTDQLSAGTAALNESLEKIKNLARASGNAEALTAAIDQVQNQSVGALQAGVNKLSVGVQEANTKLPVAGKQVTAGVNQLAGGASALQTQYQAFSAGIDTAAAGANTLVANNSKLTSGAQALSGGLTKLNGNVPALVGGVNQLASGLNQLNNNVPALADGTTQLATGLGQLNGKVPTLTAGVTQLANGLNQLNEKTPALASGVNQLADGSGELASKSGDLTNGVVKLKDGSGELASQLTDGAKTVNDIKLTSRTADMFSAPTKTTQKHYSYVANYGHALAPYVLSLALYVGALVFNFAYPIRKVSKADGTPTSWFFSKITVGALVAVGMAVAEASLIMVGGLNVEHVGLFYLFAILFSLTSMYFVMFLSMAFDNPGRFVAMVMLMLQLGGAGGTFPLEITNHFYNVIHPFLPMSYSIMGFRQAITGGIASGTVTNSVWFLIGFSLISLALLWVAMIILQKRHLMGVSQLDNNQELQAVEQ